jgi:hypothetical protein
VAVFFLIPDYRAPPLFQVAGTSLGRISAAVFLITLRLLECFRGQGWLI